MKLNQKMFAVSAVLGSLFLFQSAYADTSVFWCDKTGEHGISSKGSAADAAKAAEASCKKSKGQNCKEVFKSDKKGYGSMAYGKTKDKKSVYLVLDGFKDKKEAHAAVVKAFKAANPGVKAKTVTWQAK